MVNNLEYKLVHNFKCKRCGSTHYDKIFYTGLKTLDEENSIIEERYVCRNCNFPFNIEDYMVKNLINMNKNELLNNSNFINQGIHIKGENKDE